MKNKKNILPILLFRERICFVVQSYGLKPYRKRVLFNNNWVETRYHTFLTPYDQFKFFDILAHKFQNQLNVLFGKNMPI